MKKHEQLSTNSKIIKFTKANSKHKGNEQLTKKVEIMGDADLKTKEIPKTTYKYSTIDAMWNDVLIKNPNISTLSSEEQRKIMRTNMFDVDPNSRDVTRALLLCPSHELYNLVENYKNGERIDFNGLKDNPLAINKQMVREIAIRVAKSNQNSCNPDCFDVQYDFLKPFLECSENDPLAIWRFLIERLNYLTPNIDIYIEYEDLFKQAFGLENLEDLKQADPLTYLDKLVENGFQQHARFTM